MMREEFEKLVGENVSNEEYRIIDYVYTWHPSISGTEGKQQMAYLYTNFGMAVINAMVEGADIAEGLEHQERMLIEQMRALKERQQ